MILDPDPYTRIRIRNTAPYYIMFDLVCYDRLDLLYLPARVTPPHARADYTQMPRMYKTFRQCYTGHFASAA